MRLFFEFVAGSRLEKESFRETVRREVAWAFGLDGNRDFLVSNVSQINLEFVARLPNDDFESHVAVAFYLVDLYRKRTMEIVDADNKNRWLTSRDVWRGQTVDQLPIDPQLIYLIRRSNVISEWE